MGKADVKDTFMKRKHYKRIYRNSQRICEPTQKRVISSQYWWNTFIALCATSWRDSPKKQTILFHSKTADSDTVSTYQVSSVQLVTDKKLEAFNKA